MSVSAPLQSSSAKQETRGSIHGRLVQRKCNCSAAAAMAGECEDCKKAGRRLQAKLFLGQTHDPFEQEADRVADQVVQGAGDKVARTSPIQVRRVPASAGATDEEQVPPSVERTLSSSGQAIDPVSRAQMERRFGRAFADVRIHVDGAASESAKAIGSRAYTCGNHIAFAAGEYQPGTMAGSRLLAHELTHVVQQSPTERTIGHQPERNQPSRAGEPDAMSSRAPETGTAPAGRVQRDLATPPPKKPPKAQKDLTEAQIKAAIRFNQARYDATSTKLIQDLVGTKPTGKWIDDDIVAIARLQEEYGFGKDGEVGPHFFRFLDNEVRLEKLKKVDKNCLLAFRVITHPATVGAVAGGRRSITGQFEIRAQFSKHCGCADYEYRQFIRGHWIRERGGVRTDLGNTFTTIPGGGGLPAAFVEDGNTASAALNYGHRAQTAETINHYLDDTRAVDQANGCIFESEDTPGGPDNVQAGDIFDVDVNFRGEIQRRGRVVRTERWSAIRGRFPVP